MKLEELARQGAEYREKYEEMSEDSFVFVKEKERKTFNRILEEGIYNIKPQDYDETDKLKDVPILYDDANNQNKLILL